MYRFVSRQLIGRDSSMIKFLTIFNLIAGGASIVGLYIATNSPQDPLLMYIFIGVFGIAILLSGYILFIPNTKLERNVASKVIKYRTPSSEESKSILSIQRGEFTINQWGPTAVEFYEPFVSPPQVEVINDRGYDTVTPSVTRVTEHHAVFKRESISAPGQSENYRWVARGTCLEKK